MSDKSLNIDMVYRANTAAAKAATKEMKSEIAGVSAATESSSKASGKHAVALDQDTAASKRAIKAKNDLTAAEKRARDAALRAAGVPQRAPPSRPVVPSSNPTTPSSNPNERDDLRAQYVPLYGAQRRYEQELAGLKEVQNQGVLSTDEYASAQVRLRHAYDRNVEGIKRIDPALRGAKDTMKLSSHEAKNLSYQLNDVFQTLALGMPISQIAMQQGPQITQIYGGVGNTFKALKAAITPARLALGVTTGVVLTGAVAWNSYLTSIKAVETASAGLGRATAGSAAEMEAAAMAGAAAAGISMKSARAMQVQFLRTGAIGSENFEEMIALSKDFAATMGIDASAAGGALAEMFADPAKAADLLYRKYGLIDGATARYATNLARQNRYTEAQSVLVKDLSENVADATEATTALARGWDNVKLAAAGAGEMIGKTADAIFLENTTEEKIAEIQAGIERLRNQPTGGVLSGFKTARNNEQIADAQQELDRLLAKQAEAKADAARKKAAREGARALADAQKSPANSIALKEERLRNQLASLQVGQNAPDQDEEQRRRVAVAIEATNNAINGLNTRKERTIELDRLDIQIQNERNPLLRAELEARRTRLQMADQEVTADKIATEAARAYNRVINQTIGSAAAQAADLQADLVARQRLNALVATGVITADDANRMLSEELVLRPLVTAAAAAEGAEKTRLLGVITELKSGYAELATEQRRASGQEFLRGQQETLEKLRVEASLLGMNATNKARILALMEAELEIRHRGLDANGQIANDMRTNALQIANERRELEKQAAAWGKVQSAAEGAIDTMTDDLLRGDFSGALDNLAKEITGMFAEIAIKNPLKNALLGADFETIGDIGGLSGIWSRLTGQSTTSRVSASTKSLASMNVTAASVVINAGPAGLIGGNVANTNAGFPGASGASGSLGGSDNVQQQVWDFFKAKGLEPHQIAGIMGNVSAESSFDPLARGDGGDAYGLFQHNDRAPNLLNNLGGIGNLGDVQGQLEFAWKELMTSESAAMKRLMSSTDVRGATGAFVGFERPQGYSVGNPAGSMHWDRRLSAAESALSKFGSTAGTATQTLGTLGSGFDSFGSLLSQMFQGGAGQTGGGQSGGGFIGMLINAAGGALGLPGFMVGGATGGSNPAKIAGLVHESEYVFDAAATARIGVPALEAMRKGALRGFRSGGYATATSGGAFPSPSAANTNVPAPVNFTVHNYSGQSVERQETTDASGGRQITMTIGEHVAGALAQPGNALPRQFENKYGVKQRGVRR